MGTVIKFLSFMMGFIAGVILFLILFFTVIRPAMASVTEVTRDTYGVYEQCMNDHLRRVHITTKDDVRKFDKQCTDAMQFTPTFKQLDLVNQSAVNQRTLKFRAELMEIVK